MKLKRIIIGALVVAFTLCLTVSETWADNVGFNGAKVGVVEARSSAWGGWLIITLYDASGNKMRLCDTASDATAMALPLLSDPAAKSVMAIALTAKASGKTVSGWGIEPPQGGWCGIGYLSIDP